jgi:glyoxylase I family protein
MSVRSLGFHHLALQARDVEHVASFYREVLGLAEIQRFHRDDGSLRSLWLSTGDSGFLAIEHLVDGAPTSLASFGLSMIALRIDPSTRGAAIAEFERRGVPVVNQTSWTVYVRDPEGTLVGLSHHPFDAPP